MIFVYIKTEELVIVSRKVTLFSNANGTLPIAVDKSSPLLKLKNFYFNFKINPEQKMYSINSYLRGSNSGPILCLRLRINKWNKLGTNA